jgi:FKBP-type peptidyl-prolyl cis-trans isomerase SlpA
VVEEGKTVKVSYTLTVEGKVFDTSEGKAPLEFTVGGGGMIPGFEKGLMGMKKGEEKTFEVSPEEGYGPVDPKGFAEVPRDRLPPELKPEAGGVIYAKRPDGRINPVKVLEVKEDSVVIDLNHPLAGKALTFEVEIVEIK